MHVFDTSFDDCDKFLGHLEAQPETTRLVFGDHLRQLAVTVLVRRNVLIGWHELCLFSVTLTAQVAGGSRLMRATVIEGVGP